MSVVAPGWPCALLPTDAPSVADVLAAPTADTILPQLLHLTPRGPAWGTDEAGGGQGAEPIMLGVWRALAGRMAAGYRAEFDLATQCFPSAITYSLDDWEDEYGLPDSCTSGQTSTAQRIAAVRGRFGAVGGCSPAYYVCLAASLGYEVTIEEPGQFACDDSELAGTGLAEFWFVPDEARCDDTSLEDYSLGGDTDPLNHDNEVSAVTCWKFWIVHVGSLGETWFRADEGELDYDPLEGLLLAQDLECVFRRVCPPHTVLIFDYTPVQPVFGTLDFSLLGNPLIGLL